MPIKKERSKRTRYEHNTEPEKYLPLSILHYLEKDLTPREISRMMGIDVKYLELWLIILAHFKYTEADQLKAAKYGLTPKGKKLANIFQHQQS